MEAWDPFSKEGRHLANDDGFSVELFSDDDDFMQMGLANEETGSREFDEELPEVSEPEEKNDNFEDIDPALFREGEERPSANETVWAPSESEDSDELEPEDEEEEEMVPNLPEMGPPPTRTVEDVSRLIVNLATSPRALEMLRAHKLITYLTSDTDHVTEILKQLLFTGSLAYVKQAVENLDKAGFKVSLAVRVSLLAHWDSMREAAYALHPSRRGQVTMAWKFLRDHYVIRYETVTPHAQPSEQEIHNFYKLRDDLVDVGLWIDSSVARWRRWPATSRSNELAVIIDKEYGQGQSLIRLGVSLSPLFTRVHDREIFDSFGTTIPAAVHGNGGLLRLYLHPSPSSKMAAPIYRHLVVLAEQAVVRSLGYIQFIVIKYGVSNHKRNVFNGGTRYNWKQKKERDPAFVAPLTQLSSYGWGYSDIPDVALQISELLLPENLSVADLARPLIHAAGISIQARSIAKPANRVWLLRHLVAMGNRDSPWPLDIHVLFLPFDPSACWMVLAFLVELSQVWSRRLILSDRLKAQLIAQAFNTASFWANAPFGEMWPRFIEKNRRYIFLPTFVTPKSGKVNISSLLTSTKKELAPSDSQPKFPRGRYGTSAPNQ